MMRNWKPTIFFVCLTMAWAHEPVSAWLRPLYEDAIVVERSELIVIGRLKKNSIEYVPHTTKPGEGIYGEHRAQLIISEILKGETDQKEIPIIIHYGLTPIVGEAYARQKDYEKKRNGNRVDYPDGTIEIWDTGHSAMGSMPLVDNALDDNIWLLRRSRGPFNRQEGNGDLGIVDPEDLRPIQLKTYFMAYLSEHPHSEVRKQHWILVDTKRRARRYLDHLTVEQIQEIDDVEIRLEALKGFYIKRQSWTMKREARDAIIACGRAAAPLLEEMFDDPNLIEHRGDIIRLFVEIDYQNVVPKLIQLLEAHIQFWQTTPLVDGRWNHGKTQADRVNRSRIATETVNALYALRIFGDASATSVIRATKRLWEKEGFESEVIIEACDRYLDLHDGGACKTPGSVGHAQARALQIAIGRHL